MARSIRAFTLSQVVQNRLDDLSRSATREELSVLFREPLPKDTPLIDELGLQTEDYDSVYDFLRVPVSERKPDLKTYDRLLTKYCPTDQSLVKNLDKLLHLLRSQNRQRRMPTRQVSTSRMVEALLMLGMDTYERSLGNDGHRAEQRSSSEGSDAGQTQGQRANTKTRKTDAAPARRRTAGAAA